MSKTVREEQFKFYLSFLDALMDENYFLETVEVEDNVIPESLECKNLSGKYRLKSLLRNDKTIEKIFIKIS